MSPLVLLPAENAARTFLITSLVQIWTVSCQVTDIQEFGMNEVDEVALMDAWLKRMGLNTYGDRPGAIYMGGTPLFNERTGESTKRIDYVARKFPDRPWRTETNKTRFNIHWGCTMAYVVVGMTVLLGVMWITMAKSKASRYTS